MLNLTEDNLQEIIKNSNKPVFVDMYADWCGPCKMITPIVDDIAVEYAEKLEVIKVNVDENPKSAAAFGVRSIPTLLVFNDGEVMNRHAGAVPKSKIVDLFIKYVS